MNTWRMIVLLAGIAGLLAAVGCKNSGDSQKMADKQCFSLVEGDTETTIVIEGDKTSAKLTLLEHSKGEAVAEPESFLGRLEEGVFVQATGLRLQFDKEKLTWPEDSLLPGAVFKAVPCP